GLHVDGRLGRFALRVGRVMGQLWRRGTEPLLLGYARSCLVAALPLHDTRRPGGSQPFSSESLGRPHRTCTEGNSVSRRERHFPIIRDPGSLHVAKSTRRPVNGSTLFFISRG